MLDFPRIQLFIISVISLLLLAIAIKKWHWYDFLLIVGLVSGLVINSVFLFNYTPLVPVDVPTAKEIKASDNQLSLLIANVK